MTTLPPGTARVKPEYLISYETVQTADDDAAEGATNHASRDPRDVSETVLAAGGTAPRKKLTKAEKKAFRGANKGSERRNARVRDAVELCWKIAVGEFCDKGDDYLEAKDPDIRLRQQSGDEQVLCPSYADTGYCRFGYKCRFLHAHMQQVEGNEVPALVTDIEKQKREELRHKELNFVDSEFLKQIRSRKYPTPIADEYLHSIGQQDKKKPGPGGSGGLTSTATQDGAAIIMAEPEQGDGENVNMDSQNADLIQQRTGERPLDGQVDTPDVPSRFVEKKRLYWKEKTYLAPLTTVGNLPFRRLCVSYGADITCGEMALATSLLQGSKEEWSLLRRHPSETTFGIQIAGNKPAVLTPACEAIAKEFSSGVDFVDLNCGCPIDLVFKAGSGSALLDAAGKLTKSVIGMNKALGEIPVTVKLRTGVKDGHNNAHKLMPRLDAEAGAAGLTLHGRTRAQRYTKLADWNYIKSCVEAVRAREEEEDLPRIPIFGGGDCFSSQEYWQHMDESGVDGVMIGRGALIKPWIFTEIKERREWDISARERLDGIRQYAEYAVSHFGSDTAGVNTARRYLCEALSFQYRYIPIGLLETLPSRINDRAPMFKGRDELEMLLASPKSSDWVKISEMFLGPAPPSWSFTPKHKSNAYESQG